MEVGYKCAHLQAPLTPNNRFFGCRRPNGQKAENKPVMEKLNVILYAFFWRGSVLFPRLRQQPSNGKLLFFIHNKAVSKCIL